MSTQLHEDNKKTTLRRGWTTGACATAAAKAATLGLITGESLDPVEITLPKGQNVGFALNSFSSQQGLWASASIIKDAGDDPDVTHGALITAKVKPSPKGTGLVLLAGDGVGTVTREGLPIAVGDASITPVPRSMITQAVTDVCEKLQKTCDLAVTFSIEHGEELAKQTLNPRLGIVGGLSILGTTGIVIPYSCSSWIHSIHRGIDVARAADVGHVLASTGNVSETAANALLKLPDLALLDMGDFAGGLLKYLARHPIVRLTIAGGPGKLSKLAQGHLDLHSSRSSVDLTWLCDAAGVAAEAGETSVAQLVARQPHVCAFIAKEAAHQAQEILGADINVDCMVFDRRGSLLAKSAS